MVFRKKDHLVGLDIGSSTIKASEIIETKKGRTLEKFGMIDIESGLIEDGSIKNPDVVAGAIKQLYQTHQK